MVLHMGIHFYKDAEINVILLLNVHVRRHMSLLRFLLALYNKEALFFIKDLLKSNIYSKTLY